MILVVSPQRMGYSIVTVIGPFVMTHQANPASNATDSDQVERKLHPEDQARVDEFLNRGVNSVERKPFRPFFLIILLIAVVTGFSLLSQGIARWAGIY